MEQLQAAHEPRVWTDDRYSSNTWGPLPPRSYFRFDDAAVASERESLEMLGKPLAAPEADENVTGYSVAAYPERACVPRSAAAVALRRRLPGRRLPCRSRRGRRGAAGGARAAPRPGALCGRVRRLAVATRRAATSCSIPSRSQYKEFFLVVSGLLDGEPVTTCPFIWVDQDFALARGWIQGFPKKLGEVWITRTFGLDAAAAPGLAAGSRFGGTCARTAVGSRRPGDARAGLERTGPMHNEPPLVNVRYFPRLAAGRHDEPEVHELVRARSRDRAVSEVWEGDAELELHAAPGEEHAAAARRSRSRAASASRSRTRSMTSRRCAQAVIVAGRRGLDRPLHRR